MASSIQDSHIEIPHNNGKTENNTTIEIPRHFNQNVQDIPGHVTKQIGSGNHAKDSVVWNTIKYSFWIGIVFSLIACIYIFFLGANSDKFGFPLDVFLSIWDVFIPIITLSIGYMFGKST